MARRILIAGNWKMNKTAAEARTLLAGLKEKSDHMTNVDVAVCPSYTTLAAAAQAAQGSPIEIGAQSVHWEQSGAFTGEISAAMLKEIPVKYAIVGHSERRQYFGETDETVNRRLRAALAADLIAIMCIGESLEEREAGQTESVVERQIRDGLSGLSPEQAGKVVVAYEPIWAIGTGLTATPEQAQKVHAFIRSLLNGTFGEIAAEMRILYGGSMKPTNSEELLKQPDIDGGLVGGASLAADTFVGIIDTV